MGKFTIKELLELNISGKSKLRLKNLLFVSDEIMGAADLGRLMTEGMSEGFRFEMRGRGMAFDFEGKWGYVDSDVVSPQTVAMKRSRGCDAEKGSLSKRRTLESYKKKDSVSTVDQVNLCERASVIRAQDKTISNGRSETEKDRVERRKADFEIEIRVAENVKRNHQPISHHQKKVIYKSHVLSKKICQGVADQSPNKATGAAGILPSECECECDSRQPVKAFTASNVDSEESARKALRAAMIKNRFTDTITKVQEDKTISQGNMAQKERLEETKKADTDQAEMKSTETKFKPKTSKKCGVAVELANKATGIGNIPSDSQPKAFTASNMESEDSTRKLLRADMIKSRFADIILKAQKQKILSQGNKADQKKRLEGRKADTEAEIKAAESKLKEQRQKEREAARLALENMGRSTVQWNHALEFTRDIEKLIGSQYEVDPTPFTRDQFKW